MADSATIGQYHFQLNRQTLSNETEERKRSFRGKRIAKTIV